MNKESSLKSKIKRKIRFSSKLNNPTRTTVRIPDEEMLLLRRYYQSVCEEFDASPQNPPSFNTAIRHLLMLALGIQGERHNAGEGLGW